MRKNNLFIFYIIFNVPLMEPLIYETILIGLLRRTGVRTRIQSFDSSFLFVEICRIRGPPSFDLKKF